MRRNIVTNELSNPLYLKRGEKVLFNLSHKLFWLISSQFGYISREDLAAAHVLAAET